MKFFKKLAASTMITALCIASVSTFANVVNQEPDQKTVNGVEYLDGIPVYTEETLPEEPEAVTFELDDDDRMPFTTYDKWYSTGTSYYYDDAKSDEYENATSRPYSRHLSATSVSTVSITGEMGFSFEEFVSAKLSAEVGYEWEESYDETVTVQPWTKYCVKTACNVKKTNYQYNDKGLFSNKFTAYYASSHDDAGGKTWIWENPL